MSFHSHLKLFLQNSINTRRVSIYLFTARTTSHPRTCQRCPETCHQARSMTSTTTRRNASSRRWFCRSSLPRRSSATFRSGSSCCARNNWRRRRTRSCSASPVSACTSNLSHISSHAWALHRIDISPLILFFHIFRSGHFTRLRRFMRDKRDNLLFIERSAKESLKWTCKSSISTVSSAMPTFVFAFATYRKQR